MNVFFTVSTIRQLPQALALGESLSRHHPGDSLVISLCDDPKNLPVSFRCPYRLLFPSDLALPELETLSNRYNPEEFAAALKPLFSKLVRRNNPTADWVFYVDPSVYFYQPLSGLDTDFAEASLLLTPHLLRPPADNRFPDEKYFQNLGLFHSGFIGLHRGAEAERFLTWWSERVPDRAAVNFCEGQCADQLWLMMAPALFEGVSLVKHPGWQVGIWNLYERSAPFIFFNFKGLVDRNGLFGAQTRVRLSHFPAAKALLHDYRRRLEALGEAEFSLIPPAYGRQPIRRRPTGWRGKLLRGLHQTVRFIETVDLPRK